MTVEQVAEILRVPRPTLATWRCNGRVAGLDFVRVGGAIRYRRADVEKFIQKNLHQAGAQSPRATPKSPVQPGTTGVQNPKESSNARD